MVPPPDTPGDEFPDFERMTPEEQMAWLESLAKRQGASDEELITSADLDIPIPEDVEIDEPGYVPFSASSALGEEGPRPTADEDEGEETSFEDAPDRDVVESDEEQVAADLLETPEAVSELDTGEFVPDMPEAMQWFDSLAVHSDDDVISFTDDQDAGVVDWAEDVLSGADEVAQAGISPGDDEVAEREEAFEDHVPDAQADAADEEMQEAQLASAVEASTGESGQESEEDPLQGMDPMMWLESLAKRQGAAEEELTTSADLAIEELSADEVVVDEPGYVPFEGSRSARELAADGDAALASEASQAAVIGDEADQPDYVAEPVDAAETLDHEELEQGETTGVVADWVDSSDVAEEDADLAWLEDLAQDQVAEETDLTASLAQETDATTESIAGDAVEADERAATDDFSFDAAPHDSAVVDVEDKAPDASIDAGDEALHWLEDLAAEPEADLADYLAVDDDILEAPIETLQSRQESDDNPLAGMTDEEIAEAQMRGDLTGEQELAWLKRQAAKLAEARAEAAEDVAGSPTDLAPAAPAEEIPGWVAEMRPGDDLSDEDAEVLLEFSESAESEDMPGWLEEIGGDAGDDVSELLLEADVETLWTNGEEVVAADIAADVPTSELEAFLASGLVPDELDPLAEALDEEYERKLSGDEAEPEWYAEAVARVATEEAEALDLQEAVEVERPGWGSPDVSEDLADEGVADWLRPADADEVESLQELDGPAEPDIVGTDVLAGQPGEKDEIADEARIEPATAETIEECRRRLEADPNDYPSRLTLARALRDADDWAASLDEYEALIDAAQLLSDVSGDLDGLVAARDDDPRVYRLLGDAFMRQGLLQEALAAYRDALNRL